MTHVIESDKYIKLTAAVERERELYTVYPPREQVFEAYRLTPPNEVKVVIVGQDPYHEPGQAMGLAFSVPDGCRIPPSLVNIFKEINAETGTAIPSSGNLTRWATQGVLLLNTSLTVRAHCAGSHSRIGWQELTSHTISVLSQSRPSLVFMLWGTHAQRLKPLIDTTRHLVLESVHPSPLAAYRGFFGNGHFAEANKFLISHNSAPIKW